MHLPDGLVGVVAGQVLQVAAVLAEWGRHYALLDTIPALVLPELYLVPQPETEPFPDILGNS